LNRRDLCRGHDGRRYNGKRQNLFDQKRDAGPVCHKLRNLCPRNAKFINIEVAPNDLSLDALPPAPDRVRHSANPTAAMQAVHAR
jgi:hypothetical protein